MGYPVGHSLSPVMHTAAFRALRLDALYTPFEVSSRSLAPILRSLILAGVEGLNLTVPLKEAAMPLMDRLDPTARAMGAVNTIVVKQRRTIGYNTDGVGFSMALKELGWRPHAAHAVILGAGGAARAVAWELARVPGSQLTIANRHVARARALARWVARHHPRVRVRAVALSELRLQEADLVVNATTVGLRARDEFLIDPAQLRRETLVYDLIYHHETSLVRTARRRGCLAANGLSMLLYQGAESLRLWLHRPPPIQVMRHALMRAMKSGRRVSVKKARQ